MPLISISMYISIPGLLSPHTTRTGITATCGLEEAIALTDLVIGII